MEKMRQASIKHEEGKTYGYLYVQREAIEKEKPRHNRAGIYWVCDCMHCGRKNVVVLGDYLRNGDTQSCGCIVSKNESKIAQMLDSINFKYKEQYTFNDLSSTGRPCDRLLFDFAIFNQDTLLYLIEYDGIQHFSDKYEFKKGRYKITHQNDLLKNQYCFEHNIPLIRIPYNQEYDLNDLKLETSRFLLTKENEEEYYQQK